MKRKNPFLTAGYEGPETFCDRERETAKLIGAIENGRDVTLIAPRRYGKTGLIKNVFYRLDAAYDSVYLDIYATNDLCEFVKLFARTVVRELESTGEKILTAATTFLRGVRPTVTTEADGSLKWSFEVTPTTAEVSLDGIFSYLKSRKRPVVIAIDEFQQVRRYPEKGAEALLRSYIQFLPNVHFIFAGSQRHMMADMFVSPRGPFYNSTDILSLEPIDRNKYRDFAAGFFAVIGEPFDGEIFDGLYDRFSGVTWYVQSVLNRVWEYGGGLKDSRDVERAVAELVEDRALVFRDLFVSQPEASKALLKAIAGENIVTAPTAGNFISKYRLGSASTVASSLETLIAKELVYRSNDGVFIYDRLLSQWIKENES